MIAPKNPHVWVRPPHLPVEHRGFLVEWLPMDDGGWRARVLYLDPRSGDPVWVEVPSDRVRAVESTPHTGSAYG